MVVVYTHSENGGYRSWQNFVGAHFGIYATGNQLPILQTAVSPPLVYLGCYLSHYVVVF